MKLYADQVAFRPKGKLILPKRCCCCMVELDRVEKAFDVVGDTRVSGIVSTDYELELPLCDDCFQHQHRKTMSGLRILIYLLLFLIIWGVSSLVALKAEIGVGGFAIIVLASEAYWKMRYFKYHKAMLTDGHAGLGDFAELKVKRPDLAIISFKSQAFADLVISLNRQNRDVVKTDRRDKKWL